MKALSLLCIAAASLVAAGCAEEAEPVDPATTAGEEQMQQTEPDQVQFDLQELNGSGITGQVTIEQITPQPASQTSVDQPKDGAPSPSDEAQGGQQGDDGQANIEAQVDNGQAQASTQDQAQELQITIELEGETGAPVARPAHIHMGESCEDFDAAPLFPLTNVVDGRSETTIAVTGNQLDEGAYVINVHESEQNIDEYVACGELPSEDLARMFDNDTVEATEPE